VAPPLSDCRSTSFFNELLHGFAEAGRAPLVIFPFSSKTPRATAIPVSEVGHSITSRQRIAGVSSLPLQDPRVSQTFYRQTATAEIDLP
jgi:hypothetical protein